MNDHLNHELPEPGAGTNKPETQPAVGPKTANDTGDVAWAILNVIAQGSRAGMAQDLIKSYANEPVEAEDAANTGELRLVEAYSVQQELLHNKLLSVSNIVLVPDEHQPAYTIVTEWVDLENVEAGTHMVSCHHVDETTLKIRRAEQKDVGVTVQPERPSCENDHGDYHDNLIWKGGVNLLHYAGWVDDQNDGERLLRGVQAGDWYRWYETVLGLATDMYEQVQQGHIAHKQPAGEQLPDVSAVQEANEQNERNSSRPAGHAGPLLAVITHETFAEACGEDLDSCEDAYYLYLDEQEQRRVRWEDKGIELQLVGLDSKQLAHWLQTVGGAARNELDIKDDATWQKLGKELKQQLAEQDGADEEAHENLSYVEAYTWDGTVYSYASCMTTEELLEQLDDDTFEAVKEKTNELLELVGRIIVDSGARALGTIHYTDVTGMFCCAYMENYEKGLIINTGDLTAMANWVALGMVRGGGLILRVEQTIPGRDKKVTSVRGWVLKNDMWHGISEAEMFAASCTDAATGEPIPPEYGCTYLGTDQPYEQ